VAASGRYRVALCCSVLNNKTVAVFSAGGRRVRIPLHRTRGVFCGEEDQIYNFERIYAPEEIELPGGTVALEIAVNEGLPSNGLSVCSVELTPADAQTAIEERERAGGELRADTEWLATSGYGVMFHWTDQAAPESGGPRPYAYAVRDFDVTAWADMVAETGAAYACVTANHESPRVPAPLPYWESIHPGMTTRRDLIADMAQALRERDIRMMLYLNCPSFAAHPGRSLEEYFDLNDRMLREVGDRYREDIGAYWLDGWDLPFQLFGRFPMERIFAAAKTGHPGRLVGFNHWILPVPTRCQDYWCGEAYQRRVLPAESQFLEVGAGEGLQYHVLIALQQWVHKEAYGMHEPPVWSPDELITLISACRANCGVITVNIGISQEGRIGMESAALMREVRKAIRV